MSTLHATKTPETLPEAADKSKSLKELELDEDEKIINQSIKNITNSIVESCLSRGEQIEPIASEKRIKLDRAATVEEGLNSDPYQNCSHQTNNFEQHQASDTSSIDASATPHQSGEPEDLPVVDQAPPAETSFLSGQAKVEANKLKSVNSLAVEARCQAQLKGKRESPTSSIGATANTTITATTTLALIPNLATSKYLFSTIQMASQQQQQASKQLVSKFQTKLASTNLTNSNPEVPAGTSVSGHAQSTVNKISGSGGNRSNNHGANARSPGGRGSNQFSTGQQVCASNLSKGLSSSQASTARLMDMGKKLIDAVREAQVEDVRQLVINANAPFTSDWLGITALHVAATNGHLEIAEILLKAGVNRDARSKLERTALHHAAQGGSLAVVDLLLLHGSEVNARDMLKMTPLHWAVERKHLQIVERLLLAGADVTLRSKFQLTPMDIARQSDSYEIVKFFKSWSRNAAALVDGQWLNNHADRCHLMFDENLLSASGNLEGHEELNEDSTSLGGPNSLSGRQFAGEAATKPGSRSSCSDSSSSNFNINSNNHQTNNKSHDNSMEENGHNNYLGAGSRRQNKFNYHHYHQQQQNSQNNNGFNSKSSARPSIFDIVDPHNQQNYHAEPSIVDLVELEWNALKFEPDFFLTNDAEENVDKGEDEDDEDQRGQGTKVEYLKKVVEELQKENRQLRQQVEQLSTTTSKPNH